MRKVAWLENLSLSSFSYPSYLPQIVEVILPPDPFVVGFSAVGFSGDVSDVKPLTVVELALEELGENRIKSAGEMEDLTSALTWQGARFWEDLQEDRRTGKSGLTTEEIWMCCLEQGQGFPCKNSHFTPLGPELGKGYLTSLDGAESWLLRNHPSRKV